MPFQVGSIALHDDGQHLGSAKRDVADGVAALDANGWILALGNRIVFARDGSDNLYLNERTSAEGVCRWSRVGANDYVADLKVASVWDRIQTASMKDVVSGIAALGAGGQLLAPGPDIELTRNGSENIEVVERTSGDIVYRWTRIGANDYECRINCGGVACIIQNDSMKDIAGGIAGLDANVMLSPAVMYPCLEEYNNHLGATDNFTQTATAGNGVAAADAANHEMDLSSGAGAVGYATFNTKRTYTPSAEPLVANLLIQNIVNGAGGNRLTFLGLVGDWANVSVGHYAVISQEGDDSWAARSWDTANLESTAITALSNGDFVTIVVTTSVVYFFVNGALVATHSTYVPSGAMSLGGLTSCTPLAATGARQISIDMMGVKRWY
jgi:hypothetical protein